MLQEFCVKILIFIEYKNEKRSILNVIFTCRLQRWYTMCRRNTGKGKQIYITKLLRILKDIGISFILGRISSLEFYTTYSGRHGWSKYAKLVSPVREVESWRTRDADTFSSPSTFQRIKIGELLSLVKPIYSPHLLTENLTLLYLFSVMLDLFQSGQSNRIRRKSNGKD